MNGRKTKMIRKVFKDRQAYRKAKHAYIRVNIKERIKAKEDIQEILDSGKQIRNM